jgi:hypothetical protein
MPTTVRLIKIERDDPSVGDISSTVTVHVKVQTQNMNDLSLEIQVSSSQSTDKVLMDASNRLIRFAEEIKQAVELNQGLHFE